jgi:hypothetical protein
MKKIQFSFIFFFFISQVFSQNPNWGWGPTVNTSLNGTSLTCTTTDPTTSNTQTYTISNVDAYINNEGIVATVSTSGTVKGLIYDINLQSWEVSTFSYNSGNQIQNSDGVISWVSSAGTVGGAIYDPNLQNWETSVFSYNSGNTVKNRDGVVSWVSSSGTVGGAIYDPNLQNWETSIFSYNSGNVMKNKNGVVAWISSAGTVGAAVYDPDLQSWEESIFSYSSSNNNLSISDGTVYWNNSSGTSHYGYNVSNNTWQSSYNTDLYCKLFVSKKNDTSPYLVHFSCLSIGANSYAYTAGDGHTIYRKWGFKQYQNPGGYNASLTIQNSFSNTNCNKNISVSTVQLEEQNRVDVQVFPNPVMQQQQLYMESGQLIEQVQIVDILGANKATIFIDQKFAEINLATLNLNSGTYFIKITLENKQQILKKILIN